MVKIKDGYFPSREANFDIVERHEGYMVLRDRGPWDKYMTITNAAESVVEGLLAVGELRAGQRLFYYDSQNDFDELLIENGKFAGFRPGVRP